MCVPYPQWADLYYRGELAQRMVQYGGDPAMSEAFDAALRDILSGKMREEEANYEWICKALAGDPAPAALAPPPAPAAGWWAYWFAGDITVGDGETVTTWPDGTGGGRDMTGGAQVYRAAGVNGNPSVEYTRTDSSYTQNLSLTGFPTGGVGLVAVWQTDADSPTANNLTMAEGNDLNKIGFLQQNNANSNNINWTITSNSNNGFPTAAARGAPHILVDPSQATTYTDTLGSTAREVDGFKVGTRVASLTGLTTLKLGTGALGPFDGHLIFFGITNAKIGLEADVDALNAWAAANYGVTLV